MLQLLGRMYKSFEFYTPYIPLTILYPLTFNQPTIVNRNLMPPSVSSSEAPEFVPPDEFKDEWEKVDYQVGVCMACSFPQYKKQLDMFVQMAVVMVRRLPSFTLPG